MSLLNLLATTMTPNKKRDNTIDVKEASRYGWSQLQLLCFTADLAGYLKYKKDNVITVSELTRVDINGNTALHLLARAFNDEQEATTIMEDLLTVIARSRVSKMADVLLMTNQPGGYTVLQQARYYHSSVIVDMLQLALAQ